MRRLLALALAVWAGAASAQVQTDPDGLREIGARLLLQGEAARAASWRWLFGARPRRPRRAAAARAGEAGDGGVRGRPEPGAAGPCPGRAGSARYLAARIVARAQAELGHYTQSQIWLRIARQDVPDPRAVRAVAEDYRAVRAVNPLAVSLSFGLAPSSNVNGGTSAEVVGSTCRCSAATSRRRRWATPCPCRACGSRAARACPTGCGGREVRDLPGDRHPGTDLHPERRGQGDRPGRGGSDYADLAFSEGIVHRWLGEGASGPSALRATVGRTWYGGEPYTRFAQVSFERAFVLDRTDRIDVSVLADWTERDERTSDGEVFRDRFSSAGLRGRWTHLREGGDRTSLSLGLRDFLTELPDTTYSGATLGAGYDWARPVLGTHLGLGAEIDWRRYDEVPPGARRARRPARDAAGHGGPAGPGGLGLRAHRHRRGEPDRFGRGPDRPERAEPRPRLRIDLLTGAARRGCYLPGKRGERA